MISLITAENTSVSEQKVAETADPLLNDEHSSDSSNSLSENNTTTASAHYTAINSEETETIRKNSPDNINILSAKELITETTKITLLPKIKVKRIWEIDFLRGICIILMIFDHAAMLLGVFFGPSWFGIDIVGDGFGPQLCRLCEYYYLFSPLRRIGHPVILFIFFALSGIACTFSKSNFKRGVKLVLAALLYSACSYIVQETTGMTVFVAFGVLSFYSVCILFYALLQKISNNNKIFIGVISAIIVPTVLLLYHLYTPPESTPTIFAIIFPPYDIHGNPSLFYSQMDFSPGDLFTFIPYSAFFFFGTLAAPLLYPYKRTRLRLLDRAWHKPMTFIGRHSLLIYLFHVVIITGIIALISFLFVDPGNWGLF